MGVYICRRKSVFVYCPSDNIVGITCRLHVINLVVKINPEDRKLNRRNENLEN